MIRKESVLTTKRRVTRHVPLEKVKELADILQDVLDLANQLKAGEVVSSNWIAARDMRIAEARIALTSVEENTPSTTAEGEDEPTATAPEPT